MNPNFFRTLIERNVGTISNTLLFDQYSVNMEAGLDNLRVHCCARG